MSVFTDNAAAFATTQVDAIDHERRTATRKAAALIVAGKTGRAQYELARSVIRQARIAGLGTPEIGPTCPCGGRRCTR
ncbi:hypothetical protein [Nocardioides pakistanensis]